MTTLLAVLRHAMRLLVVMWGFGACVVAVLAFAVTPLVLPYALMCVLMSALFDWRYRSEFGVSAWRETFPRWWP